MTTDDEIAQDLQSQAALDDCQCCDVPQGALIFNRPGLPALAYRAGTYATFFERMKAQLPLATSPATGGRPLAALTTRSLDDPSIALLDAAAVLGDIMTFYQERIANEGFLRTATERRSVLELAREIGYELNPGVAAATFLAFIIDKALAPIPGLPLPSKVPLDAGLKVQSVPGPGQMPQTFETTASIVAHVAWNELRARTTQRQELAVDKRVLYRVDPQTHQMRVARSLWFDGMQTNLHNGDLIYVSVGPNSWPQDPVPSLAQGIACVFVAGVDIDYNLKRTRVDLAQDNAVAAPPYDNPPQPPGVVSLAPLALDLGNVRQHIVGRDWDEADLRAYIAIQGWDEARLLALVAQAVATAPPAADVFAFRAKTGMFGNQAPSWLQVHAAFIASKSTAADPWPNPWDGLTSIYAGSEGTQWFKRYKVDVLIDRVQSLAVGSLVAFSSPVVSPPLPMVISAVRDVSAVDFAMSAKVTGLGLAPPWDATHGPIAFMRDTSAYVQSEPLALTDAPIEATVGSTETAATELMLDRMVLGLDAGQYIALTGTVAYGASPSGTAVTEICELAGVSHSRGYTTLRFVNALAHRYVRSTIAINGNVAPATHGETVPAELLGSGNASQNNQTFQLAKPLTYVAAPTASGGQDTLTVRVYGVAWQEVPTLYGAAPTDTVFTVRHGDDGSATLRFGDGSAGARLPTGANNIVATYRSGLGPAANLDAETISILASRPYGLKSGLNPVPASGGAAAELLANARQNAPRTVRTLERIVSLDDFTDFARGVAGVGKAMAVPLWSGETEVVHITVAGSDGKPIDPKSAQWSNLVAGIHAAGAWSQAIRVANFQQAYFKLTATVVVDPRRELATVVAGVTAALRQAFSFAARDLAQTVTESEIIGVAQAIPGVIAVEVTQLYRTGQPPGLGGTLPAAGAHFAVNQIVPAELLLLHPVGLSLAGVQP